jgi:hypothetical protein
MIEHVLTTDFETGFSNGYHWQGLDGLTDFLDTRSVFFDESHDVLQLMDVTSPDANTIEARDPAAVLPTAPHAASRSE